MVGYGRGAGVAAAGSCGQCTVKPRDSRLVMKVA